MRAPLRGAACGGVARTVRPSARRSAGAPAVDQPQLRVFAPRLVGDVRLGMAGLRPLERRDDLGLVVFDARRSVRRDARLDLPQYAGLHVVPYGEQAGAQGVGLHAAGRGLDRYRILVHRGRILVSVAAAGQRFRERHMGRAVVRIYGYLRRYAVGAGLQPALFSRRGCIGAACGTGCVRRWPSSCRRPCRLRSMRAGRSLRSGSRRRSCSPTSTATTSSIPRRGGSTKTCCRCWPKFLRRRS